MDVKILQKPGRWFPLLLATAAGLLFTPQARSAPKKDPKPVVMLLLDTSTSMQDAMGAATEGELPVCHDTRQESFSYTKTRWAVAVEVLTGSFYDYWCTYDDRLDDPTREDYNASPNHVLVRGVETDGSQQQQDGLLDIYRDDMKFGLMTFDPQPGSAIDHSGGFSYGPDKTWSGLTVNMVAKN